MLVKYIEPKTSVYAIAEYYIEGTPSPYVAIFPAIIKTVYIEHNKLEYWLMTPDGEEWGQPVSDNKVAKTREELLPIVYELWDKSGDAYE